MLIIQMAEVEVELVVEHDERDLEAFVAKEKHARHWLDERSAAHTTPLFIEDAGYHIQPISLRVARQMVSDDRVYVIIGNGFMRGPWNALLLKTIAYEGSVRGRVI